MWCIKSARSKSVTGASLMLDLHMQAKGRTSVLCTINLGFLWHCSGTELQSLFVHKEIEFGDLVDNHTDKHDRG